MPFDSLYYLLIFLPIVLIVYSITADRYKGLLLVVCSLLFYSFYDAGAAVRFLAYGLIVYMLAIALIKTKHSKWVLIVSVALILSILIYYKYLDFLVTNLIAFIPRLGFMIDYLSSKGQPLGLSFTTFTSISYLVDIYREKRTGANLLEFLNYLTFFPKVISGPIVRLKDFNYLGSHFPDVSYGLFRFIIGLSKKTILAYYLGLSTNLIWDQLVYGIDVPTAWIGAISYTLQIYFDFSGYSDMAIGASRMLGYPLEENFNFPYISTSIGEFWKRWHISLGAWFRTYLYYPLGGSKRGKTAINLLLVFLASGIWHGSNWTFVVWGAWHGLIRVAEKRMESTRGYRAIPGVIKWSVTMLAVVLGWVIFRSSDIVQAKQYIGIMFGAHQSPAPQIIFTWKYFLNNRTVIILLVSLLSSTLLGKTKFVYRIEKADHESGWAVSLLITVLLLILVIANIMMIVSSEHSPFIYFQF